MSVRSLRRIERGERRTRGSTLRRISYGLLTGGVDPSVRAEWSALLVAAAGPSLAPETEYGVRVSARRERRKVKRSQEIISEHQTTFTHGSRGVVEHHQVRSAPKAAVREHWILVEPDGRRVRLRDQEDAQRALGRLPSRRLPAGRQPGRGGNKVRSA